MDGAAQITQRDLEALRVTLDKLDRTVTELPDKMADTYARKDVVEPRFRVLETDLAKVQDWMTWAQRLVLGLVIVALLGAVLVQGNGGTL